MLRVCEVKILQGRGNRTSEKRRENKNHPSMMVSRSKVSGMVNFLSTVNIGKLSGKDLRRITSDTKKILTCFTFLIKALIFQIKYEELT